MKKVMILDSYGMAGHIISLYLSSLKKYHLINISFDYKLDPSDELLDLFDSKALLKLIELHKPDIIINCLRCLVEESKQKPREAAYINTFLPLLLEHSLSFSKTKIIHLSTDCVFSGNKGSYIESDYKDGNSIYAITKGLGELNSEKNLTIRTSFIGPNLIGRSEELFHWFMTQKGEINGYANAYWTGITTLELAKKIHQSITLDLTGLYHLVPEQSISKYDLLLLIKEYWKKDDIVLFKLNNEYINKSLIDNRNELAVSGYRNMLSELLVWMKNNEHLYSHYPT